MLTRLGPPLWGHSRILEERLVELIALFAEVPNRFREVIRVVGKNPRKFIAARLAEVLFLERRVFFLAGGNDPIEKMAAHKLVIGDAVKFGAFHTVV